MDNMKEKLVELLNNSFAEQDKKRGLLTAPHTATDLIAHGVTVQEMNVVEVVRCKDCVYFRPAEDWNGKKYNACYLKPNVCIFEKKMEDFCSCGERRLPQPPKGD